MWSITRRRGSGSSALFVKVAGAISDDIRRGALQAGDRLPSTRALADQLDVNRNTIVAAFDELIAQGWVVTRGPGGTFVSDELPDRPVKRAPAPPRAPRGGFDLRSVAPPRSIFGPDDTAYQLSAGVPDTRLLPAAMLARADRRAACAGTERA